MNADMLLRNLLRRADEDGCTMTGRVLYVGEGVHLEHGYGLDRVTVIKSMPREGLELVAQRPRMQHYLS